MCLSFVAGVDGFFHKQHEERTLWHCFHFFSCLHYLLLISFGWKGWLFREVRQGFLSYGLTIPPSCSCLLLLGWKGCPIRIMTQHLFGIVFTLLDVFHYFANWMPQQFMKLIQNGTPKWMHLNFAKGLRTHGFGALQSKLQMQNCLLMNMWHIHLHNGRRIISKQMSCLLRNCLPPYIVNLCILQYVW